MDVNEEGDGTWTEEDERNVNYGVTNIVPTFAWPVVVWTIFAQVAPVFWSRGMGFWGSWARFGVYFASIFGVFWIDF